jgi:high-affinity K+ transport system ATPase subunit B
LFADRFSALFVLAFILRRFWTRIRLLMSLALKGVKYREVPAGKLLSRNLLIYGLGGLAAPFIFVKLIDMLLVLFGLA